MLVQIDHAFGDREIVRIRKIVEEVEDELKDLGKLARSGRLSYCTNLITESALFNHVHADIQDVFHELRSLVGPPGSRFLSLSILVLTRPDDRFAQDLQIPRLDGNADDLAVRASLEGALKQSPDDNV
jgi:hypothetical protein